MWESLNDPAAEPHFQRAVSEARAVNEALGSQHLALRCYAEQAYGKWLKSVGRLDEASALLQSTLSVIDCWLRRESEETTSPAASGSGLHDATSCRFHVCAELADVSLRLQQYAEAIEHSRQAQLELAELLAVCASPRLIFNTLQRRSHIFEFGLQASSNLLNSGNYSPSPTDNFNGTEFVDGNKAIWVREALHRHASSAEQEDAGNWEPDALDAALSRVSRPNDVHSAPTRGIRRPNVAATSATVCVVELPNTPSSIEEPIVGPLLASDLRDWRPPKPGRTEDGTTVYIQFDFVGYDLYVIPLRRDPDGRLEEVRTAVGSYQVLEGVWQSVESLSGQWQDALDEVFGRPPAAGRNHRASPEPSLRSSHADTFRQRVKDLAEPGSAAGAQTNERLAPLVCVWPSGCRPSSNTRLAPAKLMTELGRALQLELLLELIEPKREKWKDLHLVLLPDVQLYQLPIHAAWINCTRLSLLDTVGSVRCALSLRVQKTLEEIECRQATKWPSGVPFRGALFANPHDVWLDESEHISTGAGSLRGVSDEVANHLSSPGETCWQVYGDLSADPDIDPEIDARLATRKHLKEALTTSTVLWVSGHGGWEYPDRIGEVNLTSPGLLLYDGPLTAARIVAHEYDFRQLWLFHASACLISRVKSEDADRQAEGFVAALMVRGCRRVSGAMWELPDAAAVCFAKHYAAALRKDVFGNPDHGPNSIAVALKEAVRRLREEDNGRFDHEVYWAPFVLYGLG